MTTIDRRDQLPYFLLSLFLALWIALLALKAVSDRGWIRPESHDGYPQFGIGLTTNHR